jgi:transposase
MRGKRYGAERKFQVYSVYVELVTAGQGLEPSARAVAREAKVNHHYAGKVINELRAFGHIIDPTCEERAVNQGRKKVVHKLTAEEEIFLLALRTENHKRQLKDYKHELLVNFGTDVSVGFLHNWWLRRFDNRGSLRKACLVPLDKFRPKNILRYFEFRECIDELDNHFLFNFLDEKHIVNSDAVDTRVRADPLTGRVESIPVSGNFRDTYNILAAISANPEKQTPVEYAIGKENGTAASFLAFIEYLIVKNWFRHNEVLIMDNAAIHAQGAAEIVEELLWSTEIDGRPLHVLVLYLPTRSPELNPIELIFHVLARRLKQHRYTDDPTTLTAPRKAADVFNEMTLELVWKCCMHCGY